MGSSSSTTVEQEIRELLEETRHEAHHYASAHYREHGESGLNMRLEAIEKSLLRLARAIERG